MLCGLTHQSFTVWICFYSPLSLLESSNALQDCNFWLKWFQVHLLKRHCKFLMVFATGLINRDLSGNCCDQPDQSLPRTPLKIPIFPSDSATHPSSFGCPSWLHKQRLLISKLKCRRLVQSHSSCSTNKINCLSRTPRSGAVHKHHLSIS